MIKEGIISYKIAGREAGKLAVIVEVVDDTFVLIDGNVKRRKCNIKHLEMTNNVIGVKKGASTAEVHKQMSSSGFKVIERKPKKEKKEEVKEDKKETKKKTKKK